MKKLYLLFSLTVISNSSNLEDILSDNRSRLIEAESKKSKTEVKKLERSWINPIRAEYS